MKLTENTVLITGGATGIGLALAGVLVERGNTVLMCARTRSNLDRARQQIPAVITYCCDISDRQQRRDMLDQIAIDGYSINVLINNAAILSNYDLANTDAEAMRSMQRDIAVNFVAPIELTHELLPALKKQPVATIINVNSPAGLVPVARAPIYSATKAGFYSYSRSLRHHLADYRIKVIDVFPPGVATPMTATEQRKQLSSSQFVSRLMVELEQGADEIWIGEGRVLRLLSHISLRWMFNMINKRMPIVRG